MEDPTTPGARGPAFFRPGRSSSESSTSMHTRWSIDANTREVRRLADVLHAQAAAAQRVDIGLPNPNTATTPAEFVALMRDLVAWSGMTRRQLQEQAGPGRLPKSTLDDALKRDRLPRLDVVQALTWAVRLIPEEADAWQMTWRRLSPQNQRSRRSSAVDDQNAVAIDVENAANEAYEASDIAGKTDAKTTANTEPPQPAQKLRRPFWRGRRNT